MGKTTERERERERKRVFLKLFALKKPSLSPPLALSLLLVLVLLFLFSKNTEADFEVVSLAAVSTLAFVKKRHLSRESLKGRRDVCVSSLVDAVVSAGGRVAVEEQGDLRPERFEDLLLKFERDWSRETSLRMLGTIEREREREGLGHRVTLQKTSPSCVPNIYLSETKGKQRRERERPWILGIIDQKTRIGRWPACASRVEAYGCEGRGRLAPDLLVAAHRGAHFAESAQRLAPRLGVALPAYSHSELPSTSETSDLREGTGFEREGFASLSQDTLKRRLFEEEEEKCRLCLAGAPWR